VSTVKKDLNISASGFIKNLKDKHNFRVHFDIHRMTAHSGSKERIISQFPVKRFLMKQLHNLGTIGYRGSFDVLCSFSFTNTNEMSKMKIKPKLKLHSLSKHQQLDHATTKATKAEEKAARKAKRAEEKAARKARKRK